MSAQIRRVQYFYSTVRNRPGEGLRVLSDLAEADVNLLAFTAIPVGPDHTQVTLFPESPQRLHRMAEQTGMVLTEPESALLIQGDDHLGALEEIHRKLYDARVNIYASTGVTDGRGGYGYVLYVRPAEFEAAARALEV